MRDIQILDKRMRVEPRVRIPDVTLLKVGRWNGNRYVREEVKPVAAYLIRIFKHGPKTPEEYNALSVFVGASKDHEDSSGTWVGRIREPYWDEREEALKARWMEIVDQKTSEDIAYQKQRDGYSSYGMSPRLEVRRDGDVCRDILYRTSGIVINPAGGEELFLSYGEEDHEVYDERDGAELVRDLFFKTDTKGELEIVELNRKGVTTMFTLEQLGEKYKELNEKLDKILEAKEAAKGKGKEDEEMSSEDAGVIRNEIASLKKMMLEQKEAEEEKAKLEEEEKQKKLEEEHALMTAHLNGDHKELDSSCPACLKEQEDAKCKDGDDKLQDEEEEEDPEKKKEKEDEEDMAKGKKGKDETFYPAFSRGKALAVVPIAPRSFEFDKLDQKGLQRFTEDLLEVLKPLLEAETLKPEDLATVVNGIEGQLLTIPCAGPDPEYIKGLEKQEAKLSKEKEKEIEEEVKKRLEREKLTLSKPKGRKGGTVPVISTEEKTDKEEFVSPHDRLGACLSNLAGLTGQEGE